MEKKTQATILLQKSILPHNPKQIIVSEIAEIPWTSFDLLPLIAFTSFDYPSTEFLKKVETDLESFWKF